MSTSRKAAPVFGVPLRVLCERAAVEVPPILADLLRWLAAHALAQPDVFAQAPKCAATSQLKGAIDTGVALSELLSAAQPARVGSLLKRWLEELPDPLLNWDEQVELLSACKDEGCIEARIGALNDAVAQVDHFTLGTLKPLLLFLQQYCFRQRRFDQQLLQVAVAFAPILFPAALAAGPDELRLAEETVATLISNALHIFNPALAANVPVVTPAALCEAAAEMLESQQQQQAELEQPAPAAAAADPPPLVVHHSYDPHEQETHMLSCDLPYGEDPFGGRRSSGGGSQLGVCEEPHLHEVAFRSSLDRLVAGCVTSCLFASDDEEEEFEDCEESSLLLLQSEDDCGSLLGSTASTLRLLSSRGGASSSGGGSRASSSGNIALLGRSTGGGGASSGGGSAHAYAHPHTPHPGHTEQQQHKEELPYSPDAQLVAHPWSTSADGQQQQHGARQDAKGAPSPFKSTAAAEALQHQVVSRGGVVCVIKAQPSNAGTAAASGDPHARSAASGAAAKAPLAKGPGVADGAEGRRGPPDLAPIDVAELLLEQAALLCGPQMQSPQSPAGMAVGARRPSEGGASLTHAHHRPHGPGVGVMRALSRLAPPAAAERQQERRTSIGGCGQPQPPAAVAPQQQHQRARAPYQLALPQSQPQQRSPGASSGGGAAPPRRRQTMGGDHSSDGGRGSSGGGGVPPAPSAATAATTATQPPAAELGTAGYLRVFLAPDGGSLLVREADTAAAAAARVPLRSLSSAEMLLAKEALKRQLKDVSAAFEARAGRPLTAGEKEVLRPIYIRYHKLKALIAGGASQSGSSSCGSGEGSGGGGGSKRTHQLVSPPPILTA